MSQSPDDPMKRIRQCIHDLWLDYGLYVIILGGLAFGVLHAMSRFSRCRNEGRK